jgi:large conductance mechanosensitive channel
MTSRPFSTVRSAAPLFRRAGETRGAGGRGVNFTVPTRRGAEITRPMSMLKEFKEFAMRGNVVDMAVGVIMGAAFAPIVSTLVENMIMPILGYILAGIDFAGLMISPVKGVDIKYGLFINAIIKFLMTAFAIFLLVKGINTMKKKFEKEQAAAPPPPPPASEVLLKEILDAIVAKK